MIFTEPHHPTERCTCCGEGGELALDRTYRRCRACYSTCPAIGGCAIVHGEAAR